MDETIKDEEYSIDVSKIDKKKVESVLTLVFLVCVMILMFYAVKIQNDYNECVVENNRMRQNMSNSFYIPIDYNENVGERLGIVPGGEE